MDRGNHYETAFEAYLRDRRLGYVAIDESRRTSLADEPVKSIDFIVHGCAGAKLLVDVKGRKFPGGTPDQPRFVWQNWVSREDVEGLNRWEVNFGAGYAGIFVFAYHISPDVDVRRGTPDLWVWRGNRYLMRAVTIADYRQHVRVRSPKWDTVHISTDTFRRIVRPLRELTHPHECTA